MTGITNLLAAVLLCGLLAGCDFIGGGETVVRGSHNLVVDGGSPDAVAWLLDDLIDTPAVTDSELRELLDVIRSEANAGNLDAALVLLRLAAIQRAPKDGDET